MKGSIRNGACRASLKATIDVDRAQRVPPVLSTSLDCKPYRRLQCDGVKNGDAQLILSGRRSSGTNTGSSKTASPEATCEGPRWFV